MEKERRRKALFLQGDQPPSTACMSATAGFVEAQLELETNESRAKNRKERKSTAPQTERNEKDDATGARALDAAISGRERQRWSLLRGAQEGRAAGGRGRGGDGGGGGGGGDGWSAASAQTYSMGNGGRSVGRSDNGARCGASSRGFTHLCGQVHLSSSSSAAAAVASLQC